MKRTVLQIPMSPELKRVAESKAKSLGFSSLQELVRVMLTQITRGNDIRVDDICEKYGIGYLGLFGSMARGEAREDSDVDLLVEFMPDAQVTLFGHFDAEQDLSKLVGKKEILAEARSIYAA